MSDHFGTLCIKESTCSYLVIYLQLYLLNLRIYSWTCVKENRISPYFFALKIWKLVLDSIRILETTEFKAKITAYITSKLCRLCNKCLRKTGYVKIKLWHVVEIEKFGWRSLTILFRCINSHKYLVFLWLWSIDIMVCNFTSMAHDNARKYC